MGAGRAGLLAFLLLLGQILCNEQIYTTVVDECSGDERDASRPTQCCRRVTDSGARHRYAYMTVLGGVGNSYQFRGYVYNIAIMGKLLRSYGSEADLVVIIIMQAAGVQEGLAHHPKPQCATPPAYRTNSTDNPPLIRLPPEDEKLLEDSGVIVKYSELMHGDHLTFNTITVSKALVWRYTEYEAIQFLDADVLPRRSMDAYFGFQNFTVCAGTISPLNAGWLRLAPRCDDYKGLRDLVVEVNEWGNAADASAPHRNWTDTEGWGSTNLAYQVLKDNSVRIRWKFYAAVADQGLLWQYFRFVRPDMVQIRWRDVKFLAASGVSVRQFPHPELPESTTAAELELDATYPRCHPSERCPFEHFAGPAKPWNTPQMTGKFRDWWWTNFDHLGTGMSRASIPPDCFSSPLGYKPNAPAAKKEDADGKGVSGVK